MKAFQKAQALAPNDVGVQTRLASARMGAGEPDAAMGDLEHTLQLAPTEPQVAEALFFAALATGDLNKAAEAIDKARTAQGETPVVGNLEGLLKLAQLDIAGAEATVPRCPAAASGLPAGQGQSRSCFGDARQDGGCRADPGLAAGQGPDL